VAEHQAREVDRELVRGRVRADRIAELALVAEVHDLLVDRQRQLLQRLVLAQDVLPRSGRVGALGGGDVVAQRVDLDAGAVHG